MEKINILDFLEFKEPTQEQVTALQSMAAFVTAAEDDYFILSGAAGTGKTSITTALIQFLTKKDITYKIAAPTGRAARILGKKCRTASSTIHSLIYNTQADPDSGEVNFRRKENPVNTRTVYILDEASMISTVVAREEGSLFFSSNSLLNDLIWFVKDGHKKNQLVFLGDRNQLPPVFEDFSKALSPVYLTEKFKLKGKSLQLTEVKRQQRDSYILKNAVYLREAIDDEMPPERLEGIETLPMRTAASRYVLEYIENGWEHSISIAASHKMNKVFNEIVREFLFYRHCPLIVPQELLLVTQTWKRGSHELYSGDHVIVQEINLDALERVAGLNFAPVKLLFRNIRDQDELVEDVLLLECISNPKGLKPEQERALRSERFKVNKTYQKTGSPSDDRYVGAIRTTYGYSITCHKAQGGEWKKVYVNSYYLPSLRYQYTAITRAREELILY